MDYFEFKIHLPKLSRRWLLAALAVLLTAAAVLAVREVLSTEALQPLHHLTLTRRKTNSAYGAAAYSFLEMSHDADLHANAVDVRYEGCGALHIGSASRTDRFQDLGLGKLEDVSTVSEQGWSAPWLNDRDYVMPRPGHVYVLGVRDRRREVRFYVKFAVREVSDDAVDLVWAYLNEDSASKVRALGPPTPGRGKDGTNGLCASRHRD